MRQVDRVEGLALLGQASLGPLSLGLPALFDAGDGGSSPLGPALTSLPSPAGERRLAITSGDHRWELSHPILAPEVTAVGAGIFPTSDPQVALLHAPLGEEAMRALNSAKPGLVILGNARTLWNEGEPFVQAVRTIRETLGAEPLLWAPRVALPHRLPLLNYLGVDLADTTEGLLQAAAGTFFDLSLGTVVREEGAAGPACDCFACRAGGPQQLVDHARAMYARSASETRAALRRGRLRELVEARQAAEPALVEHLRHADRGLRDLLQDRSPVTGAGRHTYTLAESQRRPEMDRFRRRFLERYRPPPSKAILLLVPCSRTKPYRVSPSHRRFAHAFDELRGTERIHLVSVSSPLGLVPRELEDVPPARHYDVPVTGDWSPAERGFVLDGLRHLLSTGGYRAVVLHLDPEEYGFLREAIPPTMAVVATVSDHRTTAGPAIARLRAELARLLEELPPVAGGPRTTSVEEFLAVASIQFGPQAAARLLEPPVRLMGRPWFLRLTDGHQDLATLREERGLLHLTLAGAARLGELLPKVEVDPKLALHGDLFAPGVVRADPGILAGDSVGLFQEGSLCGVGEAALSSRLMQELRRGVAVRVRHHQRAAADTNNTEGPLSREQGR